MGDLSLIERSFDQATMLMFDFITRSRDYPIVLPIVLQVSYFAISAER